MIFPSKSRLQEKGRACCLTVRQYIGQKGHLIAVPPGVGGSGGFLRPVRSSSHIDLIFAERRSLTVLMIRFLIATGISSASSFGSECRVSPSSNLSFAGSQVQSVIRWSFDNRSAPGQIFPVLCDIRLLLFGSLNTCFHLCYGPKSLEFDGGI